MHHPIDRRGFLRAAAACGVASGLPAAGLFAADEKKPKLRKAVKFGMIRIDGSVKEKFDLIKRLGFQGVEIDSPSKIDRGEAAKARDDTGIVIHGVIDSVHWRDTLSDPDPAVRARGLEALKGALADAAFYGADTVLLVPGVVNDKVSYEQCWERSTAEVRKAIPVAEKLKVKIAVEVVWNNFLTKPEQLIEYVDQFKTPAVGAYFDCSNMIRYGVPPAEWIRKLGKRMLKFDFKGFSLARFNKKQNPWVAIGEGDEDWPAILKALADIGYNGWATSEVAGGGEKELREVAQRMNKVLGLG